MRAISSGPKQCPHMGATKLPISVLYLHRARQPTRAPRSQEAWKRSRITLYHPGYHTVYKQTFSFSTSVPTPTSPTMTVLDGVLQAVLISAVVYLS